MNSLVKQRLVGILVMLSVAAILWPIIFTPQKHLERTDYIKIPSAPQFETSSRIDLDLQKLASDPKVSEEKEQSATLLQTAPVSDERSLLNSLEKPKLDSKGIPIAYILQVVSMSDKDRAENVRNALLELEHKAYLRQVKVGEVPMYRVYVGPKFERTELMSIKPQIDEAFTVDSVVLRYTP